jgi:hypothetical protein
MKIGTVRAILCTRAKMNVAAISILLCRFRRSPVQQKLYVSRPVIFGMSVQWNPYFSSKYARNWIIYRNSFNKIISQHKRHSCYFFFDVQNVESNEAAEIQELLRKVGSSIRSKSQADSSVENSVPSVHRPGNILGKLQ